MGNLENKIKNWIAQGLMSKDQGRDILLYEKEKTSKPWVYYSFLVLGVMATSIGVISLIAANWAVIPPSIKLFSNFCLLIMVSFFSLKSFRKNSIVFEVLLLLLMLLYLASIGLVAQIFHTGGEIYQALFLWLGLTLGLALYSQKFLIPFIWVCTFFINLSYYFIEKSLIKEPWAISFTLGIPLLVFLVMSFVKLFKNSLRSQLYALEVTTVLFIVSSFYGFEFLGELKSLNVSSVPVILLSLISLVFIWGASKERYLRKVLMSLLVLDFVIVFYLYIMGVNLGILGGLPTVMALLLLALYFVSLKKKKMFQFFLVLIGIRFLLFYFMALGGLALTGVGLIISGGGIILCVYLWSRYQKKLTHWAERVMA